MSYRICRLNEYTVALLMANGRVELEQQWKRSGGFCNSAKQIKYKAFCGAEMWINKREGYGTKHEKYQLHNTWDGRMKENHQTLPLNNQMFP